MSLFKGHLNKQGLARGSGNALKKTKKKDARKKKKTNERR